MWSWLDETELMRDERARSVKECGFKRMQEKREKLKWVQREQLVIGKVFKKSFYVLIGFIV